MSRVLGLCITTQLRARDQGLPLPAAAMPFSPRSTDRIEYSSGVPTLISEEPGIERQPRSYGQGTKGKSMMRQGPKLPGRIREYFDAHGGLERWRAIEQLSVSGNAGGASFSAKHQGKTMRDLNAQISLVKQRAVFVPFPKSGQRGVFDGDSVRIESDGHEVMAERSDPRSAFHGFRHQLWWDKLDMIYFCGYALWNYLTLPFLLAEPGFELRELEPWKEAGETWQRIGARFPSGIHTHSREQIFYFDETGLLRRHDYTAEVFGRWSKATNYSLDHRTFDGLVVSTRHKVYLRGPGNRPLTAVTLIWINLDTVRVLSRT